jgi:uncharacterized OB-fold protein
MGSEIGKTDCFVVEGKLALPYTYFAGRVGSKFITTLRDRKRILGVRCDPCAKVFVPPRQACPFCMEDLQNHWIELPNEGVVTNYTVVRYDDKHLPRKAPFILALIKLEGADTPMAHLLEGIRPEEARIGLKVKPVFAKETTNTILDIDHFEPL